MLKQVILAPVEDGGAGMNEDDVSILDGSRIIYEIDFDDMAESPLKEIKLQPGTILHITQDNDDDIDLILESM